MLSQSDMFALIFSRTFLAQSTPCANRAGNASMVRKIVTLRKAQTRTILPKVGLAIQAVILNFLFTRMLALPKNVNDHICPIMQGHFHSCMMDSQIYFYRELGTQGN